MKIAFLFVLFALTYTFTIQNKHKKEENVSSVDDGELNPLGFTNTRGSLIYDEQITSFKAYAVTASSFYGPLALDNLKFITNKMNNQYSLRFNVFMQMKANYYTSYKIASAYNEAYASLGPGSNTVQPDWSYLLFVTKEDVQPLTYVFRESLGQGQGYSSSEIQTITKAVLNTEGSAVCYCIESQFQSLVSNISTLANNIICQSQSPTASYFEARNDRWLVIKPRNCFYTIWSNN